MTGQPPLPKSDGWVVLGGRGEAARVAWRHENEAAVVPDSGEMMLVGRGDVVVPSTHARVRWVQRSGAGSGDHREQLARAYAGGVSHGEPPGMEADEAVVDPDAGVAMLRRDETIVTVVRARPEVIGRE